MGSLIQPNQLNQAPSSTTHGTFDDLLREIVKGNVVLVLGHEGILNESISKGGNVKDLMFRHFVNYMKNKVPDFNVSNKDFDDYFYRLHPEIDDLKDDIVDALKPDVFNFDSEEDYSPLLFDLLKRRYFRLVMTTTYDYYIEAMLTKVWGRKPRVISIYDAKNDIGKSEIGEMDMEPTLYYLFGKAEEKKNFVLIENDAIKVTEKWFCDKPCNLLDFLSKRTILALGTKFDDWLFRFFWFILHRDIRALKRGKVAISLNPEKSEIDQKLCRYLDNEKIRHNDMEQVIQKILDGYDEAERKYLESHGKQGADIFISYYSADYEKVKHFFSSLDDYLNDEKQRVSIWFDKNTELQNGLKPGDDYRRSIQNAIENCKIFIPVITKNVKNVLEHEDGQTPHFFIDEEWQAAISRKNLKDNRSPILIIPFVMDGLEITAFHPSAFYEACFAQIKDGVSVGTNKTELEYKNFLATIKTNSKND
jgi:hypothetical protein